MSKSHQSFVKKSDICSKVNALMPTKCILTFPGRVASLSTKAGLSTSGPWVLPTTHSLRNFKLVTHICFLDANCLNHNTTEYGYKISEYY